MIRPLCLILAMLCWPLWAMAQQAEEGAAAEAETSAATEDDAGDTANGTARAAPAPLDDDAAAWEQVAKRAENLVRRDTASQFALNRLRAELVAWRDVFLAGTGENGARLVTVDAQIAALGALPESGEEPAAIADRRAVLEAQRQELAAPSILAQEAYARANGLISEIDAILLQRQAAQLTNRGPSPLDPSYMMSAAQALWNGVTLVATDIATGATVHAANGQLQANLPRALLLFAVAVALLGMGRRRITGLRVRLEDRDGKFLPVWQFLLSLVQIAVPVLGLNVLRAALEALDIFGVRSAPVVAAIPAAGFLVVFAWWLGRQVFPVGHTRGYLGYDGRTRRYGRRCGLALAWILSIGSLLDAAISTVETDAGTGAAIEWPVLVLLGLVLWQFGNVIRTKPEPIEGQTVSQGTMRGLIGRFCIIVAIGSPLMAAFGYADAARALMVPAILSLSLAGLIFLVQRLVHDVAGDEGEDSKTGAFALLPILISFVIYVISLPIFALIWGARVNDLLELWTRFREGFSIGESRISPTDFLTFALVFALGYLLTRFIQGTLRKSVLPRTRLDLGGQNAIVSGFGYVGIILAAIIAITSAGINLSSLAIVAGALSVGIGFGLQNIVSNFVSGIILLIERPVSEGDWIEVGGQMGYVRGISVRSTRIETFDRTDVIVPNADLVSGQVTNWTRGNLIGRAIIPVGVAYGSDVDKVMQILREIAEAHPMVIMTPPPSVLFRAFGADSLDFEIRAILRDVNYVLSVQSEMNQEINKRFAEAGIEIPFAQRDIWLRNPEVLQGESE